MASSFTSRSGRPIRLSRRLQEAMEAHNINLLEPGLQQHFLLRWRGLSSFFTRQFTAPEPEEEPEEELDVDDFDAPNVFPYKMCSCCKERMSCGCYNADKEWLCENCYTD